MKNYKQFERGQALVVIALAAVVLFGFAALAIDGSAKFSDRRHAQNAADTASLAGALALVNGDVNWKVDAIDRAADNGYNNDLVSSEVWVYLCNDPNRTAAPLDCGPYEGQSDYLEVVIRSHVNTTFARVLGFDQTHNLVQAVALTRKGGPLFNGAAFASINPSPNCGNGSVYVGGNGTVNLYDGGIFVNSNVGCGYVQPNCTALTLNLYGGIVESAGSPINSCDPNLPTDENQDQILIPDEIYMPPEPIECSQTAYAQNIPPGSDTYYITPGYYSDFPQYIINGDRIVGNRKHIIMQPGVYCVGSDIKWSGNTFLSLDGSSGVTIYIKSGNDFSLSINSPIILNASNSGEYKGYLIIQDGNRNNIENCAINGGSYLNINGTIFAPYCNIAINGDNNSNAEINAQIIGWDLKLNGGSTINIHYDPDFTAQEKRRVGLMR